jgi:hypothetical protein
MLLGGNDMDSPHGQHEDERVSVNQHERFPRLIWPIAFRLALVVLFGIPIIWVIEAMTGAMHTDCASGPFLIGFLILTVMIGIPSLVVAVGLALRKRRTAWFAIVYDMLAGSAILAFAISGFTRAFVTPAFPTLGMLLGTFYDIVLFPHDHYEPNRLSDILMLPGFAAFALALIAEGAYLLHRMRVGRKTWSVCGCAVAAILALSLGSRWIQARQLNPLLDYTRAHWMNVPRGSDVSLRDEQGYSCSLDIRKPDEVFITIWLNQQDWKHYEVPAWVRQQIKGGHPRPEHHVVVKKHCGRWYFVGDQNPSDGWECLMAGSSDWQAHPPKTADDALKLIREVGVTDPDLRLAGETKMFDGSRRAFCFWSPRAQGTYAVPVGDGRIHLFLRDDVDIR